MSRSLGIPVKLLHEASCHIVTVELKSEELYRGSMIECEDNWNCQLEDITFTAKVNHLSPTLYQYGVSSLFHCYYWGQMRKHGFGVLYLELYI